MSYSTDTAVAKIKKLGMPKAMERIWNDDIPKSLVPLVARPKCFFSIVEDYPEISEMLGSVLPLWECCGSVVFGWDDAARKFVRFDTIDASLSYLGDRYQRFIAAFFVELIWSDLMDYFPKYATFFEFRYLNEILEIERSTVKLTYVDRKKLFEDFLNSIED